MELCPIAGVLIVVAYPSLQHGVVSFVWAGGGGRCWACKTSYHSHCTHIYMYTCMHICIYTNTYLYIYRSYAKGTYVYVCMCICMYIRLHIYVYIHMCIHVYIHVRALYPCMQGLVEGSVCLVTACSHVLERKKAMT